MRFFENVKDWLWQVFTDHPYEWTDSEGEIYVRVMPRSRKTQSNIPKVVAAVLLVPIILGATACGPGEPFEVAQSWKSRPHLRRYRRTLPHRTQLTPNSRLTLLTQR